MVNLNMLQIIAVLMLNFWSLFYLKKKRNLVLAWSRPEIAQNFLIQNQNDDESDWTAQE